MTTFSQLLNIGNKTSSSNQIWSDFLFDFGSKLHQLEIQSKKATVLLIVPVVEMALPLIALGYLHTKLNSMISQGLSLDYFRNLPLGTPLIYEGAEGPQHAVYDGITKYVDKCFRPAREIECVKVRVGSIKKGLSSNLLRPDQLHKITVVSAEQGIAEVDLGKNAGGTSKFTRSIFKSTNDMSGLIDSIWMIGKIAEVKWELEEVPIFSNDEVGTFNELLRVDQLIEAREPAFAKLISCFSSDLYYEQDTTAAKVTVFRESASYLKHHHNYYSGSKVLLMDYSDRQLNDVIESYNQKYYNRADDLDLEELNKIENIICAGFLEAA